MPVIDEVTAEKRVAEVVAKVLVPNTLSAVIIFAVTALIICAIKLVDVVVAKVVVPLTRRFPVREIFGTVRVFTER